MSNYNVDTLENKIIVEAQEAIKSLEQIIGYVKESKNAVDSLKSATGLKAVDNEAKKTTSSLTKMQLVTKNLKKALNFTGLIYGAKKIYGFLQDSAKNSIEYVETLNLFEVSMGKTLDAYGNLDSISSKYYNKALNFQNRLNEAFGTNIEETMRYQALYNQMTKSMGVGNNASYIISENLTKLGIDLASLFNKEESATMEALRAGVLAGQTKPLRNYGLDVTQQSMKPILGELGIDKSINELSQAEKMILRYIAVLRQASASHGDFAKTIESPANQLKVLKSQFEELKIAAGNLFQGLLGQILPWANAIIMVIKELVKVIGSLFGVKVTSANNNLAKNVGIDDLDDGIASVGAGLGGAAKNAKELRNQLMGFDEINNIITETSSSGGGGGAGGGLSAGGIDSKLLDALSEYDNLMNKVRMKATEIRDKIMDWLGFTKIINPLTGQVSWKLRDGWTNLKKIWTIIKGLIGLGIAYKTIKLVGNLTKLWETLKGTQTATSAFGKGLKTLKDIFITTGTGAGKHAAETTLLNIAAVKATLGISGLILSLKGSYDSMKQFSEGTKGAIEASLQLAGSIAGATASGALIGSIFGPAGTVLGALTGYLLGAKAASIGYTTELDKNYEAAKKAAKECEKYSEAIRLQDEAIQQTVTSQLAEVEYTKTLTDELMSLVDANGKVKEGYEARVSYILQELNKAYGTEYSLIDGQIKQYDELKENIYKTIEAKRAEILLEGNQAIYSEAVKRDTELYILKANAIEENKKAINELKKELDEYNRINGKNISLETVLNDETTRTNLALNTAGALYKGNLKTAIEYYETTSKTAQQYTEEWGKNNEKIIAWENLKTALIKEDSVEINKAMQVISQTYSEETENQTLTLKQQFEKQKEVKDQTLEYFKKNNYEINEDLKQSLDNGTQIIIDKLIEQTKNVKELSGEQKEAWKYLAESDKEAFNNALKDLPEDVRKKIVETTTAITTELGNTKPKVETKAIEVRNTIKNTLGQNFELSPLVTLKPTVSIVTTGASSAIKTFNNAVTASLENRSEALNRLSGINRAQFRAFAEGGFPSMGEIFMAREAGPELVGRIGRRTAVANNGQIVEAVSKGVYDAVLAAMPGGSTVSLDIRADEGIIVKKAANGFKEFVMQTGELPFPVPV